MPQHIGHKTARRVLIVEDVPRFREMLLRTVRDMDFVPRGVESGEEGLRTLEEEPVEIALVDLGLPGMSGLEFCEKVRKKWNDIQLIILTGYGDLDAAKQAIRLDVVDFLTKPCEHSEMEVALDRALRRSHQLPDEVNINADALESSKAAQKHTQTIEQIERKHILDMLQRNDGNRTKTAKDLGISVRTLYYRLNQYKILGDSFFENQSS